MNAIGLAGRHGPIRKVATLKYRGTCPCCGIPGALTIRITPYGERPSCQRCLAADVVHALKTRGTTGGWGPRKDADTSPSEDRLVARARRDDEKSTPGRAA